MNPMEIKVSIQANISIQNGKTNVNEILLAIGNWSKKVGLDVCKGVIENYQKEIVTMLCNGQGETSWLRHEYKGSPGQICTGGSFHSGGTRNKERTIRTHMGELKVKMQQVVCGVCGKRFSVLLPLLKIPPRGKPTIKLQHMMAETVTDLSYRKGSSRIEGLAEVVIPKSTLHRWMTTHNWEILMDKMHTETNWKNFTGIMADGTGYKRQDADTTKGDLRLVFGVKDGPKKLIPLGAWADKSWEEIDKELLQKRPSDIQVPVLVVDGKDGQALENLTSATQRCQWHIQNQLGYFLWKDKVDKQQRESLLEKLSGIIKIKLPKSDYQEISPEMQQQVQEKLKESKKSIEDLIRSFHKKGYIAASQYLRNALEHIFTVVEKWLEIGYMPPKVISLLERVMREMGRRIKKIGASWKEKGVIAIAHVLLTRIYTPEQWEQYWVKLLDIQNRCVVKSYHISFSVISSCTIPGHY